MITYRDRWFCTEGDCVIEGCDRRVTREDEERADELGLPFSFMEFNTQDCYEPGDNYDNCECGEH